MQWFEDKTQYNITEALPDQILKDPKLALVRVYDSGKTQPGWGAKEFMLNYERKKFFPELALKKYHKYGEPFALVMRSLPLVCVDIDGKNGGELSARAMFLPPTLGEVSRSGNGYHLFYRVPYTDWNDERGYAEFPDIVGLVPGVDIKGTGLVFHYATQRWNDKDIELLPPTLMSLIGQVRDIKMASRLSREGTQNLDEDELVVVHDMLKTELHGKIEQGSRNHKLYAIGARMQAAGYPGWSIEVFDRGLELGLEANELRELIRNVELYG